MATESEIKAVNKFNKEKTKVIPVRLNFKTDADILSHLETVSSKMGYIISIHTPHTRCDLYASIMLKL